jgi:hypothetical protein
MQKARWDYIKALKPQQRYFHVSAKVAMIPHPTNPLLPAVPWVQKPGKTYSNVDSARSILRRDRRKRVISPRQAKIAAKKWRYENKHTV